MLISSYRLIKEYYQIFKFINSVCNKEILITEILDYAIEIKKRKKFFLNYSDIQLSQLAEKTYNSGSIDEEIGIILYGIARILKPSIILETGCGWGVSSAYFLCALNKNEKGKLFSIDFPRFENKVNPLDYPIEDRGGIIPTGKQPGWVITNNLRNRWELILGKSCEKLPPTLNKLGQIDIFLHDSSHSFDNMLFEYQTTWPFIKRKGILLSHNINLNNAFFEFCKNIHKSYIIFPRIGSGNHLGAVVKI